MAINYIDPRSIRPVTERLTGEALEAIKNAVEGAGQKIYMKHSFFQRK